MLYETNSFNLYTYITLQILKTQSDSIIIMTLFGSLHDEYV